MWPGHDKCQCGFGTPASFGMNSGEYAEAKIQARTSPPDLPGVYFGVVKGRSRRQQVSIGLTAASSPIDPNGLPTDGHIPHPLPLSVLNPTKCLPVFATSRGLSCALAGQGRQIAPAGVCLPPFIHPPSQYRSQPVKGVSMLVRGLSDAILIAIPLFLLTACICERQGWR
ncbi:hypothetical protein BO85DRAFT_464229 [Aspergillus piperis CBS 112811]|uniref:Uncharacterized protein n=1 Tax=Aspergillus piperis CBS 112811 TaxID=1448313 RepID=A0A8G1QQT6_9EURO|nr:hypothetical protein BO85DRAFT_464229 [Aspergillus piperis CBS 112811]RAH52123.1 hypothetical protein BO85DRAFT_464229 [Aspergillus piperis CBS 112811]